MKKKLQENKKNFSRNKKKNFAKRKFFLRNNKKIFFRFFLN